jgi:hypothetical protein
MLLFGGIALGESDARFRAHTVDAESEAVDTNFPKFFLTLRRVRCWPVVQSSMSQLQKLSPLPSIRTFSVFLKISKGSSIDWGPLRATQRIPAWIGESS